MVSQVLALDRDQALMRLATALRKPRAEASAEVNWLLVREADDLREARDAEEIEAAVWEAGAERQLNDMEDAPGGVYQTVKERRRFEDSLKAARASQVEVEVRFNTRRETFAQMLTTVRESGSVLFAPDVIGRIKLLNEDDFLANAVGLTGDRFRDYYGQRDAQGSLSPDAPGRDDLSQPAESAASVGVDFTVGDFPAVPSMASTHGSLEAGELSTTAQRQRTALKLRLEDTVPTQPETTTEPDFDL